MDEFALHKGASLRHGNHGCRANTGAVGRPRQQPRAIRPFFELLGEHCQRIEAVAMDMNTAFDLEVKQHCPQAEVVYDLFHVVARYGRDVIDRIRVDQANLLREDKPARGGQTESLAAAAQSQPEGRTGRAVTGTARGQPAAGYGLCTQGCPEGCLVRPQRTRGLATLANLAATCSRERPRTAATLCSQPAQIRPRHPCQCSLPHAYQRPEGVNNRIKVIKRMAYGFRDSEYFFLKIKAAFPGKRDEPEKGRRSALTTTFG